MEKETILATLIGFITGIAPKVFDWLKLSNSSKREDLTTVIEYLKEEVNDLRQRLDDQSNKIEALHDENVQLKIELAVIKGGEI